MKKPETYIKEIDKLIWEFTSNYTQKEINKAFIKYNKPTHWATGSLFDAELDEDDESDGD